MKPHRFFAAIGLIAALAVPAAFAQSTEGVAAKAVVTAVPKNAEQTPKLQPNDFKVKVNGKSVVTDTVTPLRGDHAGLELVILIDGSARSSLGRQMGDIRDFVQSLPPTTEVAIAYMLNGRAVFQQPFTADKQQALKSLHLPGGSAGSSASPYFCISDLARNWPSHNMENRREVIAITDGIDPYEVRFDPDDPYVHSAIQDSVRAGMIVNAIYWHTQGLASHIGFVATGGQSLLTLLTENTGGRLYYQGLANPVSFSPFFSQISKQLNNQYELGFTVPPKEKSEVEHLSVKLHVPGIKLSAPDLVFVPGR